MTSYEEAVYLKKQVNILKVGITDLETDAVVNAANEDLMSGGGVCGAIFKSAGYEKLNTACKKIGHVNTGYAAITPGFDLKAKYIIHTVGPIWRSGTHKESRDLYLAYKNSLELAEENKCDSIGFPLISAGIYGYPAQEAWKVALSAVCDYLTERRKRNDKDMLVVFSVIDDKMLEMGEQTLEQIVNR